MTSPILRPHAKVTAPSVLVPPPGGGAPVPFRVAPTAGSATLDTGAVPYAAAGLTIPLVDLDVLEILDPRDGIRMTIEAGDDVTGASRTFDLALRERVVDHKARTITLTLGGDEALLIDYRPLVGDTGARAHQASLRAVCNYVLGKIGAALAAGTDDADVTAYWSLTNAVTNPLADTVTGFTVEANATNLTAGPGIAPVIGSQYLVFRSVGAGPSYLSAPGTLSVRPGQTITASAYMHGDVAGRTGQAVIRFLDAAGVEILATFGAAQALPSTSWARVVLTTVVPPSAARAVLLVRHNATGANQAVGMDAPMLHDGAEPVAPFTGSTAATPTYTYAWQGAVNASAATRTPVFERRPESFTWPPGVSAWDFLEPFTAQAGLRLFCDEARVWRLVDPATYSAPGVLTLQAGRAAEGQDTIALGDPEVYATGVVVRYRWEVDGVQLERTDSAGVAGLVRVIDIARPYPGPGLAAAVLSRMAGRGRVQNVTTLADWTANPGMSATITLPGTVDQAGQVRSIEWGLTEGLMGVSTAALIDIMPGSIAALSGTIDSLVGTIDSL